MSQSIAECASKSAPSLPVSRGSAVDSELASLMRQYPKATTNFLDDLYFVDTNRYKSHQKDGKQLVVAARAPVNNLSHYQATYYEKLARPRSTKRPPATPRDPNPPPMKFDTWQRSIFVPKDLAEARTLPVKMEMQTELSKAKMDVLTTNMAVYTPKPIEAGGKAVNAAQMDRRNHKMGGKFYDTTTTGEHYQEWKPQKNIQFGELPAFTNSILYPSAQRTLSTEMQDAFKGCKGRPAKTIKQDAPNIKLEGAHDFLTTNSETYTKQEAAELCRPTKIRPQLVVDKRQPLLATTQSMHDFPGFKDGKQPRPPAAVEPLQPTIDLKFDEKQYFDTEQRVIYRGHDARANPVPEPFLPADKKFVPPTEKFATTTVTHSDFKPFEIDAANVQVRARIPQSKQSYGGKFYDSTTTKDYLKDWTAQTKPRIRHGDFHEAYKYSVPAVYKLKGMSETKESFIPMKADSVINYKPEHKPIEMAGDQIFDTEYRTRYQGRRYKLNRHQAEALKKYLLQQRKAEAKNVHACGTTAAAVA